MFGLAILAFAVLIVMSTQLVRHIVRAGGGALRMRETRALALRTAVPVIALVVIIIYYALHAS